MERTQLHPYAICRGQSDFRAERHYGLDASITVSSTPTTAAIRFVSTFDSTTLGLPKYMQDLATLHVFPIFSAGGYTDIGTQGYWKMDRQEGVHQFSGSLTKNKGAHNLKTGAEYRHNWLDYTQPGYPSGTVRLRAADHQPGSQRRVQRPGQRLRVHADRLGQRLQLPHRSQGLLPRRVLGLLRPGRLEGQPETDDQPGTALRVRRSAHEVLDRYSYWDLDAKSPISVPGYNLKGVMKFVDNNTRSPFDTRHEQLRPAPGLRIRANSKTSIRAGAGDLL